MKKNSIKPRKLKLNHKQQLVRNYLINLFTGYNIEIESLSFDNTYNENSNNDTLDIFIAHSPANDRKELERTLFENRISYYYNDLTQQSFYQLDYLTVCANAHTGMMFNPNEIRELLNYFSTFREEGANTKNIEYKIIIEVAETDKNELNADYIHGIYFHKPNSLYWFKIKDHNLVAIEKELS